MNSPRPQADSATDAPTGRPAGGARRAAPGAVVRRPAAAATAAVLAAALLAGCSSSDPAPAGGSASGAPAATPATPTPAPGTAGHAPTAQEVAQARADVAKLPIERLAAQLVVPRQAGTPAQAAAGLRDVGYGGVAVFRENLPTDGAAAVAASKEANAAYAAATRASGRDWPAFVSIDQEGGPVTRIDAPMTTFPALMALGATGDATLARSVGAAMGAELAGLGYTVVMAPDADVTTGPKDPTIGVRSAGSDPQRVAAISTAVALGYLDAGVMPTSKHFPGHGSVTADTHVGAARQDADLATLRARDLVPFEAAIRGGVPAIMTAHIVVTALDANHPATLSPKVIDGLLRRDLHFSGVVVTDALEMGAIVQRFGAQRAAVLALAAGADVLLMPADPKAAVGAIVAATKDGTLSRDRLLDSAARTVAALRASAAPNSTLDRAPGSHADVAKKLAAASITQYAGTCGAALVGSSVQVGGGDAADRAAFTAAARRAGLGVGSGTRVSLLGGKAYRAGTGVASGSSAPAGGDVAVALDVPYGLASSTAKAKLATFGRTPATFDALMAVLRGQARAAGHSPVVVGQTPVGGGCAAG